MYFGVDFGSRICMVDKTIWLIICQEKQNNNEHLAFCCRMRQNLAFGMTEKLLEMVSGFSLQVSK